jgi:hypothetical protein
MEKVRGVAEPTQGGRRNEPAVEEARHERASKATDGWTQRDEGIQGEILVEAMAEGEQVVGGWCHQGPGIHPLA